MKNEKLKMENELKKFFKNAEAVYIFGSFADNTFNKNSDIDIAVLYKNRLSRIELFKKQEKLFLKLNRDIDLVDLQDINDVFAYEIVNNSIKLKNSKFAEDYEYKIWLRYLDLQEDRKYIVQEFING